MFIKNSIKVLRQHKNKFHSNFGVLFDIDGVLIRGTQPIKEALQMFDYLKTNNFINKIPMVFLTNSCDPPFQKAQFLSDLFNYEILTEQVLHAPAPLTLYKHLHDKRTLFVTQDDPVLVSKLLNFTNPVTLKEIKDAYPTLDVMDKKQRKYLKNGYVEKIISPIETIIVLGEPVQWESYLQIIIDLLITNGQPGNTASNNEGKQCDVYICNLDFLYATECKLSRFGNGAFIHCMEMLYEKLTGSKIRYSSVIGKPSEVNFRYAEHVLTGLATKQMKQQQQLDMKSSDTGTAQLERLYMIGDNPGSDILGANLYNQFVNDLDYSLPKYRQIPDSVSMRRQTVKSIQSFLVATGVFSEGNGYCVRHQHPVYKGVDEKLLRPTLTVPTCLDAMYRILEMETIIGTANSRNSS